MKFLPYAVASLLVLLVAALFDFRKPAFQKDSGEPLPSLTSWSNAEFVKIELCRTSAAFEADVWIQALPSERWLVRCSGVNGKGYFPATLDRNKIVARGFSEHVINPKNHREYPIARYHLVRSNRPVDSLEWW